jgi:hypothetical protein
LTAQDGRVALIVVGKACDFCDGGKASWLFPCRNFTVALLPPPEPLFNSVGSWYACQDCKPLVDAHNWEAIAARHDTLPAETWVAWAAFTDHRTGPAQPL